MNDQMVNVSGSWRVFDRVTYKKLETSTINYPQVMNQEPVSSNGQTVNNFVAMAPCGGLIAFVYKRKTNNPNDIKYTIVIQNLPKQWSEVAGEFNRGNIVFVGWTIKEDLILVTSDAKYYIVDVFSRPKDIDRFITLGESVSSIASAAMFKTNKGTNLIALTETFDGFVTLKSDFYNPTTQFIPITAHHASPITAWCVIDHLELTILYACDNRLFSCTVGSSTQRQQEAPDNSTKVVKLVASSDYSKVAMLKENGAVYICSTDRIFDGNTFVLKFTSNDIKINDINWSASDTIVGIRSATRNWFDLLIINGFDFSPMSAESQTNISNDTLCYTSPVWLFNEIDGVRIISGRNLDFLQRLPDQIYNVLSLTSDTPGAKLYSAYTRYKDESQYGEIFLDELKSSQSKRTLEDAVKQCLVAASLENESAIQKILLKAALFGRSFLHINPKTSTINYINEVSTNIIRYLTLINNLNQTQISMPITFSQFEILGSGVLIDRLLRRNLHEFATGITKLLKIPAEQGENRILLKWAVKQLDSATNESEEQIAEKIKNRLGEVPGISFIDIVREAIKLNKTTVARKLLDGKVSLSDQIDVLLSLGDKEDALRKAESGGDTDLILYVLMQIKMKEPLADYIRRLSKSNSLPLKLYLQCLEDMERNKLHDDLIKKRPDERERIAYSHVYQRFTSALTTSDQKFELASAAKQFREARDETIAQLCDDETRLLTRQEELEKKFNNIQLKGLSLVNTIEVVLTQSERDADLLKKEFNLTEERFCWIKVLTYGKQGNWPQLFDYGKRSTSPIGYEPFVDICLQYNKNEEARRFADRSSFSSKIDDKRLPFMFAKVQMIDEAITAALKVKSSEALHFIQARCKPNEAQLNRLHQAIEKLNDQVPNPIGGFLKMFNK